MPIDTTTQDTPKRPRGRPRSATIRCSDCGTDFKNDREFQNHNCDLAPIQIDYLEGTNL